MTVLGVSPSDAEYEYAREIAAGGTRSEFCRSHGLKVDEVSYWQRKITRAGRRRFGYHIPFPVLALLITARDEKKPVLDDMIRLAGRKKE